MNLHAIIVGFHFFFFLVTGIQFVDHIMPWGGGKQQIGKFSLT